MLVHITPYVFVRDTGTLYAETACAHGSIAVASVLGNDMSIIQPSGEALDVKTRHSNGITTAEVDGSMVVLWDGAAANINELCAQEVYRVASV